MLGELQAMQTPERIRYGVVDEHMHVLETLFHTSPVPHVGMTSGGVGTEVDTGIIVPDEILVVF